jgi:hypothetical protein
MKKLINLKRDFWKTTVGIIFCLLPLGAGAFDFTPDASRVVSDPAYLPLGGQLYGSSEYTYGNTGSTTDNSVGAFKSSISTLSNTVNQALEYGVTRDFALRVSDSYEWPSTTTSYADGAVTVTHSDGFIDPTFEAIWRALDQQDHPVNWDLLATYAPNLINAQSADPVENGTVARGGDTETLGTAISQEMRDFTFYLEGTVTYLDDRSVFNQGNGLTTHYDPSWQCFINISTQTRFSPQWSLNLSGSETFNENADASYVNTGGDLISSISQSGDVLEFTGALNFQAIPNRCVLSFIYNHYAYTGVSNTNETQPGSSTMTDEKDEDLFNGELRYVFN